MRISNFSCSYCGGVAETQHADHFIPRCLGGDDSEGNLYPACQGCNSSKGGRSFDDARHFLVLRKVGWPKFTKVQIEWMRKRGFDLSDYDDCKLYFEEHGKPEFAPVACSAPFRLLPASRFFVGVSL
jgi:hypothetical protein